MRSKAPSHASLDREPSQLRAHRGRRPRPAACLTVEHAEERPDRQLGAMGEPAAQVLEAPLVHSHLAALVALAVANEQRAAALIEV